MTDHLTGILLGLLAFAGVGVSACSGQEPAYGTDGLCIYDGSLRLGAVSNVATEFGDRTYNKTIQWTPDGSRILFDYGHYARGLQYQPDIPNLYAIHVSDSTLEEILDFPSRNPALDAGATSTMFDISPDGSRIAYATCAVSEDSLQGDNGDRQVYNYEIFVSDLDGANVERLTNNTHFDVLPAWSPDGESVAFVSDPDRSIFGDVTTAAGDGRRITLDSTSRIAIHELTTGLSWEIGGLPVRYSVSLYRLEWSPSGERIAFVALKGRSHPWDTAVYTVRADGAGLSRVSDTASGPTWSPDGGAIAMVVPEGDDALALYTFARDGSSPVKVDSILGKLPSGAWTSSEQVSWRGNLSWSPDGSAILFEDSSGPRIVPLGTSDVEAGLAVAFDGRTKAIASGTRGFIRASPLTFIPGSSRTYAWSPDGSRIAERFEFRPSDEDSQRSVYVYVVDRQGNRIEDLMRDIE